MTGHGTLGSRRAWWRWSLHGGLLAGVLLSSVAFAATHGSPGGGTSPTGANPADCPGGALAPQDPITISSDGDWTAANGVTGGSGTPSDPYLIECWQITADSASPNGVTVAAAAADVSYVVRDVTVTTTGTGGNGIDAAGATGASGGQPNQAVVEQTTVSGFGSGIHSTDGGAVRLEHNQVTGGDNTLYAFQVIADRVSMAGNDGSGAHTTCETVTARVAGQVAGDTCTDNPGVGFSASGPSTGGPLLLTGATATRNSFGAAVGKNVAVTNGTFADNDLGLNLNGEGPMLLDGNVVTGNRSDGIDIGGASYALIRHNDIEDNGQAAIAADAPNANAAGGGINNVIVDNRMGGNPYGVLLSFDTTEGNELSGTDWTDGAQSIIDFADSDTVVDAGSAKRAAAGQSVLFSDYVARASLGASATNSSVPANPFCHLPLCDALQRPRLAAITDVVWDFGDGSPTAPITDQSQGHGPVPQVSHTYASPGTYTATLTVQGTGVDSQGQQVPVSLSDTVQVFVAKPAHPAPPATTCGQTDRSGLAPSGTAWTGLGNGPARTFCTPDSQITADNVAQLVPQWRFPTNAEVTASPAVATVDGKKMVFDGDYDGMFYALDAGSGLPVWSACLVDQPPVPAPLCNPPYPTNPKNQVDYGAIVASPAVADVTTADGSTKSWVFEAATDHMWAMDAATGTVAWSFDAAGHSGYASYEIEGSPVVVPTTAAPSGQVVLFSIDCNGIFSQGDLCDKPGGVYAVDAASGALVWFFDPVNGVSYGPGITPGFPAGVTSFGPTDDAAYGAPATAGDHACGGVWIAPAVDLKLGMIYTASADCLEEPMSSPYYEAAFALDLATGAPVWHYQPRVNDAEDMDFGSAPNLYTISYHGIRDVAGFGSKDGTYTLLDAKTGQVIWVDKLTVGGNFGGFYNTTTDGKRIYLNSAIGTLSGTAVSVKDESVKGRVWAIDATTGNVDWVQDIGTPTLAQNAVVPGVFFVAGVDHVIHAYSTETGEPLAVLPLGGADSSGPAVVGDQLFSGAGTGATWRSAVGTCLDPINAFGECQVHSDQLGRDYLEAPSPIPVGEYGQGIWAFCLATDPTCQTSRAAAAAAAGPSP